MSADSDGQRKAFRFLLDKFSNQEPFTKEELQAATGWSKPGTFNTYWSKQFETLRVPLPNGQYRVSEVFRRFTSWEKFRTHVTQKRRVAADYMTFSYDTVVQFEFFMPLTNEGYLRTALDALFYRDAVLTRLKRADLKKLREHFPQKEGETQEAYLGEVCKWVSRKFGGYSISHVAGRFRADDLKSLQQVYDTVLKNSGRYLVDETTAVVRFIFPCGEPRENQFHSSSHYFSSLAEEGGKETSTEAARIRWLFYILFVQSIVEIVNGEDEIWLLESGFKNKLHIWSVQIEEEKAELL